MSTEIKPRTRATKSEETPAKAEDKGTQATRPGYGEVGKAVYERVVKLKSEQGEGAKMSDLFEIAGKEFGIKAATASANYYRIAREHGEGRGPRAPRRSRATSDIVALMNELEENLAKLKAAYQEIESDVEYAKKFREFVTHGAKNGE